MRSNMKEARGYRLLDFSGLGEKRVCLQNQSEKLHSRVGSSTAPHGVGPLVLFWTLMTYENFRRQILA
jgi:hypothetical protein